MKQFNLEEIMKNGGRCQTRDGQPARIICTDLNSTQPVVAAISTVNSGELLDKYTVYGTHYKDSCKSSSDLIPLPKRIQREYWANGYATGQFGFYSSREGADLNAGARLACVRVLMDCEEGEGLEPKEAT